MLRFCRVLILCLLLPISTELRADVCADAAAARVTADPSCHEYCDVCRTGIDGIHQTLAAVGGAATLLHNLPASCSAALHDQALVILQAASGENDADPTWVNHLNSAAVLACNVSGCVPGENPYKMALDLVCAAGNLLAPAIACGNYNVGGIIGMQGAQSACQSAVNAARANCAYGSVQACNPPPGGGVRALSGIQADCNTTYGWQGTACVASCVTNTQHSSVNCPTTTTRPPTTTTTTTTTTRPITTSSTTTTTTRPTTTTTKMYQICTNNSTGNRCYAPPGIAPCYPTYCSQSTGSNITGMTACPYQSNASACGDAARWCGAPCGSTTTTRRTTTTVPRPSTTILPPTTTTTIRIPSSTMPH